MSLWLRFADESALPCVLPRASALELERELDPARPGSLLAQAFQACGLRAPVHARGAPWTQFIPWNDLRVGYLNATLWVETLSCGMSTVKRLKGDGYQILPRFRLLKLPRLLHSQWRLSSLLSELDTEVPLDRQLEHSLALGIALQLAQLRLPAHSPRELAEWLATPEKAPKPAQRTLTLLTRIQSRRGSYSAVWNKRFHATPMLSPPEEFPEHFWDTFRLAPRTQTPCDSQRRFEGSPVYPGLGEGTLRYQSGELALFANAHPEALLSTARAVFFGRGGVLSHACVLAREKKIPCITGLGSGLEEELRKSGGEMQVRFDAGRGWIERI